MTAEELHQAMVDTLGDVLTNGTNDERLKAVAIGWSMLDPGQDFNLIQGPEDPHFPPVDLPVAGI